MKKWKRILVLCWLFLLACTLPVLADDGVTISLEDAGDFTSSMELLFLITVLALIPTLLIMMTGFTRIVIVLSFVRNALGLQQTPPNQVLVGLAIFLTIFIMAPVFKQIHTEAYLPYTNQEITLPQAVNRAMVPIREFMGKQTNPEDLNLFLGASRSERPTSYDQIPMEVLIPAFITSELRRAFIMGFLIFLPFLIIDMVVSSVLMSMGMVMLPPVMISLPFKIILFVLVDGWGLIVRTLITSFN